jgi:hypothetical protein
MRERRGQAEATFHATAMEGGQKKQKFRLAKLRGGQEKQDLGNET